MPLVRLIFLVVVAVIVAGCPQSGDLTSAPAVDSRRPLPPSAAPPSESSPPPAGGGGGGTGGGSTSGGSTGGGTTGAVTGGGGTTGGVVVGTTGSGTTGGTTGGVSGGTTGGTTGGGTGGGTGPPAHLRLCGANSDEPCLYHEHIRPIVESACTRCHTAGGIAPFTLETYDQVFAQRYAIEAATAERRMPPWQPDRTCNEYEGDFSLTDVEIAKIAAWVDSGAPAGSPADAGPPPESRGMRLSRVDLTLSMTQAYAVDRNLEDDYRCFVLEWPFESRSFVTGFSLEPGNQPIVHHAIAYLAGPAQAGHFDAADDGGGYPCFGGPGIGAAPISSISILGAWAPGSQGKDYPAGTGIPVEAGSRVILQMHYNWTNALTGGPVTDQSAIAMRVEQAVEREAHSVFWTNPTWLFGGMPIPAGDPDVVHSFSYDLTSVGYLAGWPFPRGQPLRIYGAGLHMHTRGTEASLRILHGSGTTAEGEECLLSIPEWDFDWQDAYLLKEPTLYEPGDLLQLTCQWDNRLGGAVGWGEGTDDEMCLGILYAAPAGTSPGG